MSATVEAGTDPKAAMEVEWAVCECCGLTEECTPGYAAGVRSRYGGRWLCGLCGEAVDEELSRRSVAVEEAVARHVSFCRGLLSQPPSAAERLIAVVRRVLLLRGGGGEAEKVVVVGIEEK